MPTYPIDVVVAKAARLEAAFGDQDENAPSKLHVPLLALSDRRLRLLAMWESEEALKLVAKAGLEVPHAHP